MRIVIIGVVVAALAVAGITAGLIKRYLSGQRNGEAVVAEVDTVGVTNVLVATRDLPAGTVIGANEFAWSPWPEDNAKNEFFGEGDGVLDDLKGKVIRRGIGTGEPLTRSRVFTPGQGSHMAGILRAGMRAVSIEVDSVSGVAGFVAPGDKVDVFLYHIKEIRRSGQGGGRERRRYAEPVLVNVPVLAVDQTIEDMGGDARLSKTTTLEVTPKQAEVIAVAREMGKLSLALHSLAQPERSLYTGNYTSDTELSRALGGLGEFRDASKVKVKKPIKRKPIIRAKRSTRRNRTVDVYRATEHETVVFSGKAP